MDSLSELKEGIGESVKKVRGMHIANKLLIAAVAIVVLGAIGLGIFRMAYVNFVDNYQVAYKYDLRWWRSDHGKIVVLATDVKEGEKTEKLYDRGWIITPPFVVKVHTVDMRPMQVCMNANARVLNCKLIQFNPEGLELFLSWHGRNDYEGPGSSAATTTTTTTGTTVFSEILKSYAYDGNTYPFLTVLRELKPDEVIGAKKY